MVYKSQNLVFILKNREPFLCKRIEKEELRIENDGVAEMPKNLIYSVLSVEQDALQ